MKNLFVIVFAISLIVCFFVTAQEAKPGKFKMGSPKSKKGRKSNEIQHDVILTKRFSLGKYEVTLEQWELLMGKNCSNNGGLILPVTNASWGECKEFIKVLKIKTKDEYHLLIEAEWEYACRAETKTATAFDKNIAIINSHYDELKIEDGV